MKARWHFYKLPTCSTMISDADHITVELIEKVNYRKNVATLYKSVDIPNATKDKIVHEVLGKGGRFCKESIYVFYYKSGLLDLFYPKCIFYIYIYFLQCFFSIFVYLL